MVGSASTPDRPLDGDGLRVALVRARFNDAITRSLLAGAQAALDACGVRLEDRIVLEVPGAVELALAADRAIALRGVDAVVCLGAVVQGETRHFDFVCKIAAEGIREVALRHGVPVSFGVLTTQTLDQAEARAGAIPDANRGYDAALAAVQMALLDETLRRDLLDDDLELGDDRP